MLQLSPRLAPQPARCKTSYVPVSFIESADCQKAGHTVTAGRTHKGNCAEVKADRAAPAALYVLQGFQAGICACLMHGGLRSVEALSSFRGPARPGPGTWTALSRVPFPAADCGKVALGF